MHGPLVRYLKGHGDPDLSLVGKAVRSGWPISADAMKRVVERLLEIMEEGGATAVKAARILECAVANDKRYEIEMLKLLQADQVQLDRGTTPLVVDGSVEEEIANLTDEEVHRMLESGDED